MATLESRVRFPSTISLAFAACLGTAGPMSTQAGVLVGPGAGAQPQVSEYGSLDGWITSSFLAFDVGFTGGVRVAAADVGGDESLDIIVGTGAGAPAQAIAYDGSQYTVLSSFLPFGPSYTGGIFVAGGDVTGDGAAEIIAGVDSGSLPVVHAHTADGTLVRNFFAYPVGFTGGVRVAAGDVNGDGVDDIVTGPGPGAAPQIRVFDGTTGLVILDFFAFETFLSHGVFVAAGDIDGDGRAEIVVGLDAGGEPRVGIFDGADGTEIDSFLAFPPGVTAGVRVACDDLNDDGLADIVATPGPGTTSLINTFNGPTGASLGSLEVAGLSSVGMYVAITGPLVFPECPEDLNGDGLVDGGDLGELLSGWGGAGKADFDLSGEVDGADMGLLLAAWGPCR